MLLAYCVWDGEVMCSESSKSFVLPCSLKKGVASGISVIHGGRVIPSKTGQTDFPRFLLLWGRKQLKGRAEFQIIPEYMLCTQLFPSTVFSDALVSLEEGKWDKTVSESPLKTFIPVILHVAISYAVFDPEARVCICAMRKCGTNLFLRTVIENNTREVWS